MKTIYWNQWLLLAVLVVMLDYVQDWTLDLSFPEDRYLVIGGHQLGFLCGSLILLQWVCFRFIHAFRTIRWLAHFHLNGTSFFILTLILYFQTAAETPRRYSDYSIYSEFTKEPETNWLAIVFYLFLVVQLSWIIQLVAYRRKKNRC